MKDETTLATAGRPHHSPSHAVNPPVERASTILFPTYDEFLAGSRALVYGRFGTSTHRALEETIARLEGGHDARLAPSGLQAVALSLIAFTRAGDRVLVADNVYDPTRKFCDRFLARFGVEVAYFDPFTDDMAALMTANTRVVFAESPGSLTFETPDLRRLAAAARAGGARFIVDNTWSGGFFLKPIALGAHVSVQAGTKYLSGHSDLLFGAMTSDCAETSAVLFDALLQLGSNVSADDAYLALRGMRTLAPRLRRHEATGLELARWLATRDEVARVLHPALPDAEGHAHWARDFTGSSGLFGAVLKPVATPKLRAFFDALRLFGMGWSWGGFESLCVHVRPETSRSATRWSETGPVIRIHAGLEDPGDLIADLENAFAAM
ncbi:MAG: cystathionine beta-lyase, partial [Parvularculaceae bacterium]|nr:cystathionine beta-lyase [Parvularculaceae bacterium]